VQDSPRAERVLQDVGGGLDFELCIARELA